MSEDISDKISIEIDKTGGGYILWYKTGKKEEDKTTDENPLQVLYTLVNYLKDKHGKPVELTITDSARDVIGWSGCSTLANIVLMYNRLVTKENENKQMAREHLGLTETFSHAE